MTIYLAVMQFAILCLEFRFWNDSLAQKCRVTILANLNDEVKRIVETNTELTKHPCFLDIATFFFGDLSLAVIGSRLACRNVKALPVEIH